MKKLFLLFGILFLSGTLFAQQLSFRFANPRIIRQLNAYYLQFDVQIKSDIAGTFLWASQVKLIFNNSTFDNTTFLVTKAGLFNGFNSTFGGSTPKYTLVPQITGTAPNLVYNIAVVGDNYVKGNGPNNLDFVEITSSWTTMVNVYTKLIDTSGDALAGIDFLESGMNGFQQYISSSTAPWFTLYTNPNLYDSRDFLSDYTGRFYSTTYGWSQIGGGTNNVQYNNWATDVSTTVWEGTPAITQTDNTTAFAKNVLVKNGAILSIPGLKQVTVSGNTVIAAGSGLTIHSDATNSGSFITGTASGIATYNRYMPVDANYHYLSSPLIPGTLPLGTFYPWNEVIGDWGSVVTTNLESGKGYTITGISGGGSIPFTGSLVTSVVEIPATSPYKGTIDGTESNYDSRPYITSGDGGHSAKTRSFADYGGGGWNLLGNPYTSSMQVSAFITQNYNSTPSLSQFDPNYVSVYIYDNSLGAKTYYYIGNSTGWGNAFSDGRTNIQVGQGFFVMSMNDFSVFTISPSMRVHDTGVTLKSAETPWPGVQLKVKYGANENSTLIVYNDQMTTGLDPGYDIGLLSSGSDVELYTSLVKDNGVNFARQALPLANYDKNVVPVGIDSEKGGPVTFSAYMVPIQNGTFYLEDRLAGKFTDLSRDSYSVTLPAKTLGTGRFFIHASLVTGIQPQLANTGELNLRIWTSHNRLNIEGAVSNKATGAIYDMLGRNIYETRLTDAIFNTIAVPAAVSGVYLVKVTDGNKVAVRKVVF